VAAGDRIPPDELLYRSVAEADVVGDRVLEDAVEMPACSFCRSSECPGPAGALSLRPIEETRVMEVHVRDLPPPIERITDHNFFEFLAVHDPTPSDQSHSEVRLTKRGGSYTENIRGNRRFMDEARARLAACMRVLPMSAVGPRPGIPDAQNDPASQSPAES